MGQVDLFERPGMASARGVLIGVERGRHERRGPENAAPEGARVAGIRSFRIGLPGGLWALWALLASPVGAVVLAFALVMATARWRSSRETRRGGVDPGARAS